jgi:hypothetical protein
VSGEHFFDDLARILAEPMPRRRAVRLLGATLVAAAVPGVRTGPALARRTARCDGGCGEDVRACPRVVNLGIGEPLCCGSPARQFRCGGNPSAPTCVDTCPDGIPCQGPPDSTGCSTFNCCNRFQFSGCVDGECIPNCNEGQSQCGKNCCDGAEYCCDRIFTQKSPFCCGAEDAFKEPWKDAEVASMIALVALAALAVATGGLAAIAIAGLAAGAGLGGVAAKIAGDDPPDPRYKELFRPRVPRVASVRPGDGVTPAAARALDHLIANRLRAGAYILAWIRSIEKAQGADKARDKSWAQRHRKAAAGYAREAATTLERDKSLSTVARRELERGGFVDTGVTLGQARQWQQLVRQRGLPGETTRVLRAAGVDDARIAGFRAAVSRLDTKLAAGVGVFGSLTDQRLAAANTATIKALRRAARA